MFKLGAYRDAALTLAGAALCAALAAAPARAAEPRAPPPVSGTALARYQGLMRMIPQRPADARNASEWDTARLHLRKAATLWLDYAPSAAREQTASLELRKAADALAPLRAGTAPPLLTGLREEGYYSPNDGSFQPFFRYAPRDAPRSGPLPLIVALHGGSPVIDLINWGPALPADLIAFAEQHGYLLAAPFGRGHTGFRGIGEQDVLRVVMEMRRRFAVDDRRIILSGEAAGATAAWAIAARHPDLFAGALILGGRGDYYLGAGVARAAVPAYRRRLIDAEFGYTLRGRLANLPVFALHGTADATVPVREGRHMAQALRAINPAAKYAEIAGADHRLWEAALARDDVQRWLRACRRQTPPVLPDLRPPAAGPVANAFLGPFLFVNAGGTDVVARAHFAARVAEWRTFALARPRTAEEAAVTPAQLKTFNLFLFGDPQHSALMRKVLVASPVKVSAAAYHAGAREFPRAGSGLVVVRPSPWAPGKLAVVQCGVAWGEGLPAGLRYAHLPDFIVYHGGRGDDGANPVLCAGFFDSGWQIDAAQMLTFPAPPR